MTPTRKHFDRIAAALNDAPVDAWCIGRIAEVLKELNPRFNEAEFDAASGCPQPPDWDKIDEYIRNPGTTFIFVG